MTSLAFMFDCVPEPVCHTTSGKLSESLPSATSWAACRQVRQAGIHHGAPPCRQRPQADQQPWRPPLLLVLVETASPGPYPAPPHTCTTALPILGSSTPRSMLTLAAAPLSTPNARTTGSGMRSVGPPILKFWMDRCVCAPHSLQSAGQGVVGRAGHDTTRAAAARLSHPAGVQGLWHLGSWPPGAGSLVLWHLQRPKGVILGAGAHGSDQCCRQGGTQSSGRPSAAPTSPGGCPKPQACLAGPPALRSA